MSHLSRLITLKLHVKNVSEWKKGVTLPSSDHIIVADDARGCPLTHNASYKQVLDVVKEVVAHRGLEAVACGFTEVTLLVPDFTHRLAGNSKWTFGNGGLVKLTDECDIIRHIIEDILQLPAPKPRNTYLQPPTFTEQYDPNKILSNRGAAGSSSTMTDTTTKSEYDPCTHPQATAIIPVICMVQALQSGHLQKILRKFLTKILI
jgi:hypothetical protein